jgi:hypothetical protein
MTIRRNSSYIQMTQEIIKYLVKNGGKVAYCDAPQKLSLGFLTESGDEKIWWLCGVSSHHEERRYMNKEKREALKKALSSSGGKFDMVEVLVDEVNEKAGLEVAFSCDYSDIGIPEDINAGIV